jgi:glycosyltransferase involved in cell wall biosynthesis
VRIVIAEREIRICHLITRLDLGGSAENTLLSAIGLASRGYAVDLICGRSENPSSLNEQRALGQGVRIIRMNELVRPIAPLRDLLAVLRLVGIMKRNRYMLLHTHTSKAGIAGRIAGYIARVPIVVHTPHGHIFYGYFSRLLTNLFTWLERIVTRKTDALITLTHREKRDYLDRNIGRADRIHPVLSGIDLAPYLAPKTHRQELRASFGLHATDFVAGTVARLVPVKNHALIIDAAAHIKERCPAMRFVFIGDGELRAFLENRIAAQGLVDRFIFLGWRTDIAECLSVFDLFVMCSHNEGMGRAFVEAQASGIPVIGSRVGGIGEALSEGTTGLLVNPTNPVELAGHLERLYENRADLARMASSCRSFVHPRFSSDTMVETLDRIYRSLLRERPFS